MKCYKIDSQTVSEITLPLDASYTLNGACFYFFDCTHEEHRAWVEPLATLGHPAPMEEHLRDASRLQHPSFFDAARDYDMIVFRGLVNEEHAEHPTSGVKIDTVPTTFFHYTDALVMVRAAAHPVVERALERFLSQRATAPRPPRSTAELQLKILNELVDSFLAIRQPLTQQLDHWQRELINPRKPFRNWYTLLEMRDQFGKLEALCEEQLDALQEWNDARVDQIDAKRGHDEEYLKVRLTDLVEHITRVLNHAKRLENQAETTVQLHFAATSYRTSEIMRVLTVITAIFMPLTLITGIFGMNFEHIPGLGAPFAFYWTIGGMAVVALALWGFFRAKRFVESRSLTNQAAQSRRRKS
jgi:magnesium transporter